MGEVKFHKCTRDVNRCSSFLTDSFAGCTEISVLAQLGFHPEFYIIGCCSGSVGYMLCEFFDSVLQIVGVKYIDPTVKLVWKFGFVRKSQHTPKFARPYNRVIRINRVVRNNIQML